MKKTIRTITSALLIALILISSAATAFATSYGDISWTFGTEPWTYSYGGESLTEGTNNVTNASAENYCAYYDFDAKESGFYGVSINEDFWIGVPETFDGKNASGTADCAYINEYTTIFYIEKGETILGVDYYESNSLVITIEYYGEDMTGFTVKEDTIEDYIIGYDVYEDCPEDFYANADATLTFSSGKTVELEDYSFEGKITSALKEGKNTAVISFAGKEKEIEFTAYKITSIIESADISDNNDYTVVPVDYSGSGYYPCVDDIITVTFTDGTTTLANVNCGDAIITLPNGREIYVYVGGTWDEYDDYVFGIRIAGKVYDKQEFSYTNMTLGENIRNLFKDNSNTLKWAKNDFIHGIKYLFEDPEWAFTNFRWSFDEFIQIFRNIFAFISFYSSIV